MYYVYLLINPQDQKIFYVGKGKGNRMRRHVHLVKNGKKSNNNDYLYRKIKSILERFDDVLYEIIFETKDEKEAYEKEQEFIKKFGIENLCNLSLGYNILTDEIKQKISKGVKKLYENDKYRNKLRTIYDSSEYRKSQSIAIKSSLLHKEKMNSEEVRKLISEQLKKYYINIYGEYKNNEVRCFICNKDIIVFEREFLLSDKYYCSNECRFSIRKTPQYRESMSESVKNSDKHKSIYTEEFRNNISNSIKRWWSSLTEDELEEYKKKMSESLKNSEKHKSKISTKKYRENLSNGIRQSESFKKYNESRKGRKRGPYKESEKNISRRKQAILVNDKDEVVKEFSSLSEICDYFNIKISTACVWLKNNKNINGLILKEKK